MKKTDLERLYAQARALPPPTQEEHDAQLISFAYGNVKLHNPNVTRDMVVEAVRQLRAEGKIR